MVRLFVICLSLMCWSEWSSAQALSALGARNVAAKEVAPASRDSVLMIVGRRTTVGVVPQEWRVVFFGEDYQQHGVEVRVAGRVVVEMRDGYTHTNGFRLAAYKRNEIMPKERIRVDSSQVFDLLMKSAAFTERKPTSMDMVLRMDGKGPRAVPTWFLTLYGKRDRDGLEVEFGRARMSAETGQILDLKVNPRRLSQ